MKLSHIQKLNLSYQSQQKIVQQTAHHFSKIRFFENPILDVNILILDFLTTHFMCRYFSVSNSVNVVVCLLFYSQRVAVTTQR